MLVKRKGAGIPSSPAPVYDGQNQKIVAAIRALPLRAGTAIVSVPNFDNEDGAFPRR